jgi:hypothetical protein
LCRTRAPAFFHQTRQIRRAGESDAFVAVGTGQARALVARIALCGARKPLDPGGGAVARERKQPPEEVFAEAYRTYLRTVQEALKDVDVEAIDISRPGGAPGALSTFFTHATIATYYTYHTYFTWYTWHSINTVNTINTVSTESTLGQR